MEIKARTKIETYYQKLAPAYRVSLDYQKNSNLVAETIPCVLMIIKRWKILDLLAVRLSIQS